MCGLFFRDCTIWAPANGGVTQCFLRGNTQAAKKKKNLLVMLLWVVAKGNYCNGSTILLLGEGVGDSFWQGFFL